MPAPPDTPASAASRWAAALSEWAIPDEILGSAPESPWHFPPALFVAGLRPPAGPDPSRQAALQALGDGGTVLDVGCGGGAAGLVLVPPARQLTGVDTSASMLANFVAATERLGVASQGVQGSWPEVSPAVESAEVVVCHHVVYNVADVGPFVVALSDHARRRVVVELTGRHPSSNLNPLWERFWGLRRPDQPRAQLFVDVVRELGFDPVVSVAQRPVDKTAANREDYVAFVRRRLCLPPARDAEVARAVAGDPESVTEVVTVWWDPPVKSRRP